MAKKARPKFEITPQLILVAVLLLIIGLAIAWFLTPTPTGPGGEPVPDIRDTKKSMGK